MRVLSGPVLGWEAQEAPSEVTIGVLDGLHLGHRELLSRLDTSLTPTVLTFDPHPVEVLRPGSDPRLITTIDERLALFEGAGVGLAGVLDLGEIKDFPPDRFVEDVLVTKLNARRVVVGPDFKFGRDRSGDTALLSRMGADHDFKTEIVDLVGDEGGVYSSSRIRLLIESGAVGEASAALGSRFRLTSQVVAGDKRGRDLGFPTANLRLPPRKVIPGDGVYAAFAILDGESHQAAVNVGVRPTFGAGERLIEAFIFDFDEEIYGRDLTLEFVEFLRPELEFSDIDDLIARMHDDVATARALLSSVEPNVV